MLHHRDDARFPYEVIRGIHAKEFNLGFIRPENLVYFGKLQEDSQHFTEEWLQSSHFGKLSNIQRGTLELCQNDHWVLGHLLDQDPSPLIAQFGQASCFRKSLVVPNLLLGTFNAVEMFWCPSPDLCLHTILSRSSRDNSFDLMALFLLQLALSTVGLYIDRCVTFQIMFNQLNVPQVDSNQVVKTFQ